MKAGRPSRGRGPAKIGGKSIAEFMLQASRDLPPLPPEDGAPIAKPERDTNG